METAGSRVSPRIAGWSRPAAAAIGAAAIVSALALTGVADTILTVFEPQRVAPVRVDVRQLGGIPDPSAYGTLTWISRPEWRPVAGASSAAAEAGFAPLAPASLPARIPASAVYSVTGEARAAFRFDEARARSAAARVNASAPAMPPAVASTTLTITGGPAILQRYGEVPGAARGGPALAANEALVIVQAKVPVVTSNGATVGELRDYALAQPGIPPSLAAQIRAIGDPVRTLLVPVAVDLRDAKVVTVRGTQGYVIGDPTGVATAAVWVENGQLIGVAGSLTEVELLALVNTLR